MHSTRENLIVLENLSCFTNLQKTKEFLNVLKKLINKESFKELTLKNNYLILADTSDSYFSLKKTTKNLKNVRLIQQENLNVPLLCRSDQKIILTKAFLENVK